MIRSLLLILLMSVSLSGYSFIKRPGNHQSSKTKAALVAANKKAAQINSATSYKPGKITQQWYDYDTQSWENPSVDILTYNPDGTIATLENGYSKEVYTYNEDKNVSKIDIYTIGSHSPETTIEYVYDTIVKNYVIQVTQTSYYSDIPTKGGYGVKITRNSDGNITELQEYNFYDDYTYTEDKVVIEYGADKKATKISDIFYDEGEPVIDEEWSNIIWERTDGQILSMEMDDLNADMYFSNNRVASADVSSENFPQIMMFTATYEGDSYHSKVMMGDVRVFEIDFDCIEKFPSREDFDECYSYNAELFTTDYDYDEDEGEFYLDYTQDVTFKNRTNEFGIILEHTESTVSVYQNGEEETSMESALAEVTYDNTYGYPLEVIYTSTYEEDNDNDIEKRRLLYSDYVLIDDAAITSPSVDTDSTAEYYNLQGIRVTTPTEGLYIMRQNGVSKKIYLRR